MDEFTAARAIVDAHPPTLDQATLALFLEEGHFARHIRRMRRLYGERLDFLEEQLRRHVGQGLVMEGTASGMHALAWLAPGVDDRKTADTLAAAGVESAPLSRYSLHKPKRGGLVLGFAGYPERAIRTAVRKIAAVLA